MIAFQSAIIPSSELSAFFALTLVDGNWSEWGEWEPCSATCGGGEQIRGRTCTNPPPAFGGQPCPGENEFGEEEESRSCGERPCAGEDCLCLIYLTKKKGKTVYYYKLLYVIAGGRVELRINYHAYFQSFDKIATRAICENCENTSEIYL